jgi:hypothetical protein
MPNQSTARRRPSGLPLPRNIAKESTGCLSSSDFSNLSYGTTQSNATRRSIHHHSVLKKRPTATCFGYINNHHRAVEKKIKNFDKTLQMHLGITGCTVRLGITDCTVRLGITGCTVHSFARLAYNMQSEIK